MDLIQGRTIALLICCLLAFPFLGVSQTNSNQPSASAVNTTTEGQTAQSSSQENEKQERTPSSTAPSLEDLGFPPEQTQGNVQEQERLDKRSHMLKIHQRLGLITAAPLLATIITSGGAHGRNSSASGRNLHAALGLVTAGMYFTAASYAIFAPKVPETKTRGPIRFHKALAWIHGTGMIFTPALGIMAYEQRRHGERVHGIASAHSAVAYITGAAYGAAILSVSVKF